MVKSSFYKCSTRHMYIEILQYRRHKSLFRDLYNKYQSKDQSWYKENIIEPTISETDYEQIITATIISNINWLCQDSDNKGLTSTLTNVQCNTEINMSTPNIVINFKYRISTNVH